VASFAIVILAQLCTVFYNDVLAPLVAEVQVAHPLLVKLISSARVKTDTRDTLHLARLLVANLIPTVWVPPPPVRELRALVAHRERLVGHRTRATNRIHSVLHSHNLPRPEHEAQWQQLPLAPLDRFRLQQERLLVEHLSELIRQVDAELTRLSVEEPWASPMVYLMQLPGLGLITSMTILAAIGEITRFPRPRSWSATVGWGSVCMPRDKPTRREPSPNKDGASCGQRSLNPPGLQCAIIPTGKLNMSGWPHARGRAKRLSLSLASCWWPFGMF
jgi:transposase